MTLELIWAQESICIEQLRQICPAVRITPNLYKHPIKTITR